jgi:hypothetical protein
VEEQGKSREQEAYEALKAMNAKRRWEIKAAKAKQEAEFALETPLDLGNLPEIIGLLVSELRTHAMQGATNTEWMDQQAMCVAEEAGEFIGAYRRWRGFARRAGSHEDVEAEMADVIVSTLCMITLWLDAKDAGTGEADTLNALIARKLRVIFSRGWVNKAETAIRLNKVPLPTYGREDSGNAYGLGYTPGERMVGALPGDPFAVQRAALEKRAAEEAHPDDISDAKSDWPHAAKPPKAKIVEEDIQPGHNFD